MKRHNPTLALGAIVVLVLSSVASLAQQTLDRTKVPPPGPSPVLRVPTWTKTQLSDGAMLIVSERHNLPLISFTITFLGGANQFEPEAKRGVASLTTSMLTEGTTTRTGDQLSDALQLLGTNLSANIGAEEGSFGFVSTTKNFEPTLDLVEDMMLNSTFPADALERLRGRTLVNLTQAKDQPTVVGGACNQGPRRAGGCALPRYAQQDDLRAAPERARGSRLRGPDARRRRRLFD